MKPVLIKFRNFIFFTLFVIGNTTLTNGQDVQKNTEKGGSVIVEVMPTPVGGKKKINEYFSKSLHYPREAQLRIITGKVVVTFIVGNKGEIENALVLRGIGGGCDEEALRVIKEMPAWNPALQGGKPVKVKYTPPINFALKGSGYPEEILLLIDGKEISAQEKRVIYDTIRNVEITHSEILNSEIAVAKYGKKAKNGAVLIATNKQK